MTDQQIEQLKLEEAITKANEAYRSGNPIITDAVYDDLIDLLIEEFPTSLLLKKGIIEKTEKTSRKEKLPMPMFSLNKVKSIEEIQAWMKSKKLSPGTFIVITPKYDGISLAVQEQNGACWTRGDGEVGQISDRHFGCMNTRAAGTEFYSFGEAIMSKKNFQKYKDKFANPRNMVAGLFNRDTPNEDIMDVDYIRYGSSNENEDKNVQMVALNKLNYIQVPLKICQFKNLEKEMLDELYKYWSENYQIDGLVIDICSAKIRKELGREENMNPAYAIAYKNPEWSGSAIVKVTGITWQVSKQGKLKPVIQIEPTEVSGVVISNVTGYNAAYIIDNIISKNALIKIIRSGDVIPKHIQTISSDENTFEDLMDEICLCPCCGTQVRWDGTMTELICNNPDCRDKKIAKLTHFFSTLEVEEFGEPSIIRLYDYGYETIQDILNIKKSQITRIEGFGEKSAETLLEQFKQLKEVGKPFAQLLDSLDLMEGKLGQKTIQLILDNLWGSVDMLKEEELIKISGVGQTTAETFIKGYMDSRIYLELPIISSFIQTPKQEVVGDKYKDQKICFTGCRPTKEQEQEIQSQGGEVVSGVSKNTTLLVVKNRDPKTLSSSKAVTAVKLGIKIIEISNL